METLDYTYLADLVRKAQAGNSNAFAELYAATYRRQYNYSYQYLKDEYLAQDALQETFIQVLRNIRKLQNPGLFVAWLNRINFNVCYDMQKKRNALCGDDDALEALDAEPSAERGPADEAVEIDSKRFILDQVMSLPLTESQVILMRYYQNMQIDDIAHTLGLSRSTVKRYLQSGKDRLSRLLGDFRE